MVNRSIFLVVGSAFVLAYSPSARAALVYAGVQDGALNAVATFTPTLGFVNQVTTDGPVLGLAAGPSDDFYISVGNHTDHYSNAGSLLGTITASPTTTTPALAFGNGQVYAAVKDGSLNAVAMFTTSLGFINQVTSDGPILGLAAGITNDFYISVGNHTDHYSDVGTLLGTITASPTTSTPALSFGNGLVYAAVLDGALNAVAMFTPTLGFINQVATDGPVLGLTAGASSDFYVSVGNHTDHYSDAGTLLGTITASPTTITPALSFTPTPVPEPTSAALLAMGAVGLIIPRSRRRANAGSL